MKRTLLLLFLLHHLISLHSKAGTCYVNTFDSQESINNFSSTYPGCTELTGYIAISGSDITNLDGLASITTAEGLIIIDNPLLTSIAGLSALTTVGNVNIENNPLLKQLTGLGELASVSQFRVVFNAGLASLSGVDKLTTINGFLSIGGNPVLQDLSGLETISNIYGNVAISLNDNMTSLEGLNGLQTVRGYLYIGSNPVLTDLEALTGLTGIGDYLQFVNNTHLATLKGLDNVKLNPISYVRIEGCPALSFCGVKSVCQFLNTSPNVVIAGNANGCNSNQQVLQSGACQIALPVTLISLTGENIPEGNKLTWKTSWESNNAGFNIEKSLNALQFENIGFVDGAGDSKNENHYTFTDTSPANQTYYRLKQVDHDLSFHYSKIISVKKLDINLGAEVIVFPNPSNGQLTVKVKDRNQEYSLQTEDGKILKSGSQVPAEPISVGDLKGGLYLLKVGSQVFKVVVAN